jgi:hypothetical protein
MENGASGGAYVDGEGVACDAVLGRGKARARTLVGRIRTLARDGLKPDTPVISLVRRRFAPPLQPVFQLPR